jgi:hypothetical protein
MMSILTSCPIFEFRHFARIGKHLPLLADLKRDKHPMPGVGFERILKFTAPHRGALRFAKLGLAPAKFAANFIEAVEILCGPLVLLDLGRVRRAFLSSP